MHTRRIFPMKSWAVGKLCGIIPDLHLLTHSYFSLLIFLLQLSGFSGQLVAASASSSSTAEVTRCPVLIPSVNSIVSYSSDELIDSTIATYSCLPGYERFGEPERLCLRGRWTGQTPVCAINIAIRQDAKQSSNATEFTVLQGTKQAYEAAAYLAVDGTKIYCSKTSPEVQPRWSLTFAQSFPVVAIKVYGEAGHDMADMEVSLLPKTDLQFAAEEREKSLCKLSSSISALTGEETKTGSSTTATTNVTVFLCNSNFPARQVLIKRRAYASLRLCEVEVFAQQGKPCQHPGAPRNSIVKLSHVEWPFPPGAVAVYDCNAGFTRIPTEATFHRTCQINGTWDVREPICVTNVAQYRSASQSSLFSNYNYPPWQAVDADMNTCGWTRRENEPWLQIDLLKAYSIHGIAVILDKERLFYQFHRNLLISISNRSDTTDLQAIKTPTTFRRSLLKETAGPGSGVFHFDGPVIGRFVTLFVKGDTEKFLGVCDVQILADDEIPAIPEHCGLQTPASSLMYTFKQSCYQVQRFSATNWYNAMLSCQDNGGSLLANSDYDTSSFLNNVLSNLYRFHTSNDRYWIAAKMSKAETSWNYIVHNSSSAVDQFFWAPGRPLNDGHAAFDSCVALGGHGASNWSWADYRCDQDAANWICAYGPRSCGDPMQPPASALLVADKIVGANGWKIGDRVQFECAPGHVLAGAADSVCQADGTWSSSYTDCMFVSCGEPPRRTHLSQNLLNGTTSYGSFVQYSCVDDGFKVIGNSIIGCQALHNGTWEVLDVMCEASSLHLSTAADGTEDVHSNEVLEPAPAVSMPHSESVAVGVGVALSLLILVVVFLFCGLRYRKQKKSQQSSPASSITKRTSPYGTVRRLHASQISAPITNLQKVNSIPKNSIYDDMASPQVSTQVSVSDESYSRTDPEGSSLAASDPSSNYLRSFGKAGLIKLYNKAKTGGTLRLSLSTNDDTPKRERPRVPKLIISSPIECRKTVVLDSGQTGQEVIYAQPAKLKNGQHENQYEYLETARVRGGYGSTDDMDHDDGMYADTALTGSLRLSKPLRHSLPPVEEIYDDARSGPHDKYINC